MPAICREGDDLTTGHACTGITQLDTPGQSTVRVNGILVARKTDPTVSHPAPPVPPCPPHVRFVNEGSSTVRVAGLLVARVGDSADSGQMIEGSPNVFAG